VHDDGAGLGRAQLVVGEAVEAEVLAHGGHEAALHPLGLEAEHHHHVRTLQPALHVGVRPHAEALDAGGQERGRGHDADGGAHRQQEEDVRAGDARVQDVAADRDVQPLDPAELAADRERVEQRLGRVLVAAVAGVDHRAPDVPGQQRHRPAVVVADHQHVRVHRVERHGGVDQGLALAHRGAGDRHVDDVGAQPLAGQLEAGLGPGAGLEEQVDLGEAAQQPELLLGTPAQLDEAVARSRTSAIS
jgi:hypothetical protein